MYESIRNRIASIAPSLSESQLDWATPLSVGAGVGLGASALNVVSPWDIDPVSAALASGGGTYLMGRGRSAERSLEDQKLFSKLSQLNKAIDSAALSLSSGRADNTVSAPPKKPTNKPKPPGTPRTAAYDDKIVPPRIATEANVAPQGLVVPVDINNYIDRSPLLNKDRARQYADPASPEYKPDFVKMITQDGLSDDFRKNLAFTDDVVKSHYAGSGVPAPVVLDPVGMPILMDSFNHVPHKLNSDVLVMRSSRLAGGEGKSRLVNSGIVPEGTLYPNMVTSTPQSLQRIAQGKRPTPQDPGFYVGKDQVLDAPPAAVAKEQYTKLTNSGRMAVPMEYKNLSKPQLYIGE